MIFARENLKNQAACYFSSNIYFLLSPISRDRELYKHPLYTFFNSQVSYAIGISEPMSLYVSSYGSSRLHDADLLQIIKDNFDLRPGIIVK